MKYLVTWEIDSDASTPKKAALEAFKVQKNPNSIATVFSVLNKETKKKTTIDLENTVLSKPTITKELQTAINHVKKFHPTVAIVIFDTMGRWQYMDSDFNSFNFNDQIDVTILEQASDSLTNFPFIYQFSLPE